MAHEGVVPDKRSNLLCKLDLQRTGTQLLDLITGLLFLD